MLQSRLEAYLFRMATASNLEDTLVGFVQEHTSEYLLKSSLRDEEGKPAYAAPLVIAGFIPSFLTGEMDTHVIPHVVVQFQSADLTFEKTTLTVELLISTLDDELDHSGYRDCLNIAEKLKTALFEERILGRTWRLVMPFNYRVIHVEQNATRAAEHPIYRGLMLTTFETAAPTSRFDAIIQGDAPPAILRPAGPEIPIKPRQTRWDNMENPTIWDDGETKWPS